MRNPFPTPSRPWTSLSPPPAAHPAPGPVLRAAMWILGLAGGIAIPHAALGAPLPGGPKRQEARGEALPEAPLRFERIAEIAVGKAPHGIRFSPDGKLAFVACSGEGTIAILDCERYEVLRKVAAGKVPLDLVPIAREQGWAVTQFRGTELIQVDLRDDTPPSGQRRNWQVGKGPSLFDARIVDGRAALSCEFSDELILFDTATGSIRSRFPTGDRPYPAAVTRDGVLAFVPNRTGGTVTVIDLLNEKVLAETEVGENPEGGALTADDVDYIVACGGSNELVYVNTASFEVVARVRDGVGPRPFSVAVTPGGRFGVVNHAGGATAGILDVSARRIAGEVEVGEKPIVVRMHPDGRRVFVSSEDSGTVSVLRIPPASALPRKGEPNEVIVMGMIHGGHRSSERYGLDTVRALVRDIDPDFICTEIPPNRFQEAMEDFQETGKIFESRVRVFPEYTGVIFPLTREMSFQIIPTAGWTAPMNAYRSAALDRIAADPARAEEWKAYQEAFARMDEVLASGGEEDDPRWIHSEGYDEAIEIGFSVYNRLFNDDLGPGGWGHINAAHYANIAHALDAHRGEGKRFLITYGAAHKGWILRELRRRKDIVLLDLGPFLDRIEAMRGTEHD